ncbi:MAG: hypothetical protein Q9162_000145 [Coniocarpon cinnabarinum]
MSSVVGFATLLPLSHPHQALASGAAYAIEMSSSTHVRDLNEGHIGQDVVLHGYLGSRSDLTKGLSFCPLISIDLDHSVQLTSKVEDATSPQHALFKTLHQHAPVAVFGKVQRKVQPKQQKPQSTSRRHEQVEVLVSDLVALNDAPQQDLMHASNIPPQFRHLQIKQNPDLRSALRFRADVARHCRNILCDDMFVEVETPLLFKSTPEGAREFIVPTRSKGHGYALPQSPQQYKQILMASGIPRYFQFAKCFRDEDHRADRQPEFSQLDLEMAFATGEDVMAIVERLVKKLWKQTLDYDLGPNDFPRLDYKSAMSIYGIDKPDTRLGMEIQRVGHMLPVDLVAKITPILDPIVDVIKLTLDDPSQTKKFITRFMDSATAEPYHANPDGQPGIFVYSSTQPLGGLMSLGFEAAEQLEETLQLEEGDLIVMQARRNEPFSGGSTMLGLLRRDLHRAAVAEELLEPASGWDFLWVNQFPLFTSIGLGSDPGQGGAAGIASTHHPFTSPGSAEDVELLEVDPLQAKADHYDLVLNGVELGGGSRRIHDARLQEHVLRHVLKMSEERVADFEHLLDVLRAGCPPHAGFAIGFDRLIATMLDRASIRDVIAFPKSARGDDLLVKSPSKFTADQLDTYHLSVKT